MDAVQEWEGYVIAVGECSFTARLTDLTAGETVEGAEADIPLSAVPDSDAELVRLGAYFRWTISGEDDDTVSSIAFLRDRWTAEELANASRRGAELAAGIAWA